MNKNVTIQLHSPVHLGNEAPWVFGILPKAVSATLPRRGRVSVEGTLNGQPFQITPEPDGQLSHWIKINQALLAASGVNAGDTVTLEIAAMANELEPELPADFLEALSASNAAQATWQATTTIARIDWVHWIESAKQAKTRQTRIDSACDMLASGKKRVCCFDQSGFYSKSLKAPLAAK